MQRSQGKLWWKTSEACLSPLPYSVDDEAVGRLDVDVIHAGLRGLCDESNRALPRKIALLLSSKQIWNCLRMPQMRVGL